MAAERGRGRFMSILDVWRITTSADGTGNPASSTRDRTDQLRWSSLQLRSNETEEQLHIVAGEGDLNLVGLRGTRKSADRGPKSGVGDGPGWIASDEIHFKHTHNPSPDTPN